MKNKINFMKRLTNQSAIIFLLAAAIITGACGESKNSYIFVVDLTESVSADSRAQAFDAIARQAKTLKRGDSLTVIPVTSDSLVDANGKVLHLEVGEKSELMGKDLKRFFAEAEQKLESMKTGSATYNQSDVLGAVRVAREEINLLDTANRRVFVIVLSDLVHSTREIRFEKAPNFASPETARKFAEKAAASTPAAWKNVSIYLGNLESSDLQNMPEARREAVQAFWRTYFETGGAKRVLFATDGTGQILKFVNAKNKS